MEGHLTKHILPRFGKLPVEAITETVVQEFVADLERSTFERRRSNGTEPLPDIADATWPFDQACRAAAGPMRQALIGACRDCSVQSAGAPTYHVTVSPVEHVRLAPRRRIFARPAL